MIDVGKILKRSWEILWNYKVLWVFGFLLALTSGGGGNGGGNSGSGRDFERTGGNGFRGFDFGQSNPALADLSRWLNEHVLPLFAHPEQHVGTFIWIGVAILLLAVIIGVIFALIRYPSETAIMRMVDEHEQTGLKLKFKQGWHLGWSRRAFRLWLIDLILSIPVVLLVVLLLGAGWLTFWDMGFVDPARLFTRLGIAMLCLVPFFIVFILVMILLSLLRNLFARAVALEGTGVGEAFRRGWILFKQNWKSVGLMWLVMVAIGIAFAIVGIVAFFLLIPAYLILAIPAAVVAAVPGLLTFGITSLFATSPLTWLLALLVALPFFLMVVFAPLTFLQGLYLLYDANVWTLIYRALRPAEEQRSSVEITAPFAAE